MLARAAAAAKPGKWVAIPLHDGIEHTGYSGIRANYPTNAGYGSRPVAGMIADTLEVERSSLASEPTPAVVAQYIALHDPADTIRRYERDLATLNRHWDNHGSCEACWTVTPTYTEGARHPCPEILGLVSVFPEVAAAADHTAAPEATEPDRPWPVCVCPDCIRCGCSEPWKHHTSPDETTRVWRNPMFDGPVSDVD